MGSEGQAVDGEGGAIRLAYMLYTHSSRTHATRQPSMESVCCMLNVPFCVRPCYVTTITVVLLLL